ncbi:uncharacterized protein KY384_004026 [Bacidia gigantensis]|uniref:uncharacterized protein n=1 Tax=Bacidia gigantensis TaxID=2732470 RepID=UPI001D03CB29|nr:uncharacterized protein KY384_004026 [Bacidia gigantensis]KAG8530671.1 hypothetical protein KY384_004026 [Bacidia gigantensis]
MYLTAPRDPDWTSRITDLEILTTHTFSNRQLAKEALTAPGRPLRSGGTDGNKRLAIYGDAILKVALVDTWYPTPLGRGSFSRTLNDVAGNNNLDRAGRASGLVELVWKSPGEIGVPFKVMGDTVEAVLGAVWLDSGMNLDAVKGVMGRLGIGIAATAAANGNGGRGDAMANVIGFE